MNDAINMDDLTAAIRAASDLRLQESYDRLLAQAEATARLVAQAEATARLLVQADLVETTARLRADLVETARKIDSVLTKINDEQLRRKGARNDA